MSQEHRMLSPVRGGVTGVVVVPGDKSISHRALFFGGMNRGRTRLRNLAPGDDVRSTIGVLKRLGRRIEEDGNDASMTWEGRGGGSGVELDCGNSGTTARLLAGFVTGEHGRFTLTGDRSLAMRPMERIVNPLRRLGAEITSTSGTLPVSVIAQGLLAGLDATTNGPIDVSSAQVHAGLVLAGLRSRHGLRLQRIAPMRDHTLRIARSFGVEIASHRDGEWWCDVITPSNIALDVDCCIPGDFSSAAFWMAAALILPGSRLEFPQLGLNPTRIPFLQAARAMGGDVVWTSDIVEGEVVGQVVVRGGARLRAIQIHGDAGPIPVSLAIDELPLIALLGACAEGLTRVSGASELRRKESDRISATVDVLRCLGVEIEEHNDGFSLHGPQPIRGGLVDSHGDHRLAMLAGIASLAAEGPVTLLKPEAVSISYPGFWSERSRLAEGVMPRNVP